MTRDSSEARRVTEIQQELSDIVEGILEDYRNEDTCRLGKGYINMVIHNHYSKISGFSYKIGQLELPIVDANTTVRTKNDNIIIIRIYQAKSKPDEYVLLMSNFQVRYNETRINTASM